MSDEHKMMEQWRNILCPIASPETADREIREINNMQKSLGDVPLELDRVRALISRVDPLCHCRAFNNIDFIVSAIGALSYPGSPSINVLDRCLLHGGQLPSDVKERADEYICSLSSWLRGQPHVKALEEYPEYTKMIRRTYATLGELTAPKEWLVASLVKTLKEHAYTPADWLLQFPREELVDRLYRVALGRAPSTEEVEWASRILQQGRSPVSMLKEMLGSDEYQAVNLPPSVKEAISDEEFVNQVYGVLLDREPSPDDLAFRVREIRQIGSRDLLLQGVLQSREHVNRQLAKVANALKSS